MYKPRDKESIFFKHSWRRCPKSINRSRLQRNTPQSTSTTGPCLCRDQLIGSNKRAGQEAVLPRHHRFNYTVSRHGHRFKFNQTGCKGQDEVTQTGGDVTATEGDSVKLNCSYKTSYTGSTTLFWYKQDGNNSPKLVLSVFTFGKGNIENDFKKRFSSTLDSSTKSVPLQIQNLQLSDSAVYYCALRPTVTGNTKTLYKNLWSKDNTILHNSH
ncbi:uncharacterized protein V6R79_023176 [Siganus canaliculatus]